ncbi:MAG: glycerophosphodiester phosphodiesterase [Chloroflexota bacterium]|nr:glycerophosphodiester phosphodiesterase [Chloroflexota bacterium]
MRTWIARLLLLLFLLLTLALLVMFLTARKAESCLACLPGEPRPLVIAHQGGDGVWPGNTMLAFERAASMGVDMLEMDLHVTGDGHLVLMHDETVDRTTNGSGIIEEMTLDSFKSLDAGYDWSQDEGQTYPYRGQGITPATLEEVFLAFPDMPMNIEIKLVENQPVEELFCDAIKKHDMTDKVLAASFHQEALDQFRTACPEVSTSASQDEIINFFVRHTVGLADTYSPPAQAVQVPERRSGIHILTPRFVKDSHSRDMDVHVWTVNDLADMQRLIDLGVDGIITDNPDRLLKTLGRE